MRGSAMMGTIKPGDEILTDEERERILDRAHSAFSWVGNLIPDRERFDGMMINLRDVVFALRTKKGFTDADRQLAHILIQKIKERKKELEEHLKHDQMTRNLALNLLDEISGLVKALNDLHDIEFDSEIDRQKAEIMARVNDEKRWQKYLEQLKLRE